MCHINKNIWCDRNFSKGRHWHNAGVQLGWSTFSLQLHQHERDLLRRSCTNPIDKTSQSQKRNSLVGTFVGTVWLSLDFSKWQLVNTCQQLSIHHASICHTSCLSSGPSRFFQCLLAEARYLVVANDTQMLQECMGLQNRKTYLQLEVYQQLPWQAVQCLQPDGHIAVPIVPISFHLWLPHALVILSYRLYVNYVMSSFPCSIWTSSYATICDTWRNAERCLHVTKHHLAASPTEPALSNECKKISS